MCSAEPPDSCKMTSEMTEVALGRVMSFKIQYPTIIHEAKFITWTLLKFKTSGFPNILLREQKDKLCLWTEYLQIYRMKDFIITLTNSFKVRKQMALT